MANEFPVLVGEIVDGLYRLGDPVSESAAGSILETEFGPDALPAVIKIRESQREGSEALRQSWRNAWEFRHPNLLRVYATGSSILNGVPIDYVVMERADESLEDVLAGRALTVDETRGMLLPVVAALKYLHGNGYGHSRLGPSEVLSVGDQVKLSCEMAVRAHGNETAAEDIRALGVLIVQALTRKTPVHDPSIMNEIPSPLADIARHCLDPDPAGRWTAEQVEPRLQAPAHEHINGQVWRGVPVWIYFGLAALVLIVVLAGMHRKPGSAQISRTPPTTYAGTSDPPPLTSQPPPERAIPALPAASGRKADGWWVIVAAYNSSDAAEKRTRAIAKRWPGFHVALSEPRSEKTRYLITLGQGLNEDQAEALRKRAVASGLPRDTYIKRIM